MPKDGVYVGVFVRHHLWFDECDYLSDNYLWRSFVFARSKDEVENKLEKLREHQFPEFREELAPMIYWDDEYDDMEVTDDIAGVLCYARKVQFYWKKVFILSYRKVMKSGHDTTRFLSFLFNKLSIRGRW